MAMCKNHPAAPAVGRCSGCAEEFCANCLVDIQGQKYCGACKVMALQGRVPTAAAAFAEATSIPCPLAKEALILAIVSVFFVGFILGPMAIYKANRARKMIAADPSLSGDGKAIAALVIGTVALLINVVGFAVMMAGPHR